MGIQGDIVQHTSTQTQVKKRVSFANHEIQTEMSSSYFSDINSQLEHLMRLEVQYND